MEKEIQSGSTSGANTVKTCVPGEEKGEFEAKLEGLPEKYREEILKQYDLPESSASLVSIFKHASWVECLLMAVGTVMSIGAGTYHPSTPTRYTLISIPFTFSLYSEIYVWWGRINYQVRHCL
jgi:hypothetical protein